MKRTEKLLLAAVALVGLALMSLFYPLGIITPANLPQLYDDLNAYGAFIALFFLALLLVAIFFPASSDLVIKTDKGSLLFSKQAIESAVRHSFEGAEGVNSSKITAKVGAPDKSRILVRLSVNDPNKLLELAQSVQTKISSSLEASLGVGFKSIDIRVAEISGVKEHTSDAPEEPAWEEPAIEEFTVEEIAEEEIPIKELSTEELGMEEFDMEELAAVELPTEEIAIEKIVAEEPAGEKADASDETHAEELE